MKARATAIAVSVAALAVASAVRAAEYDIQFKGCLTSDATILDKAGGTAIGMNDTRGTIDVTSTGPINGRTLHHCRVLWTASKAGIEYVNRCTNVNSSGDKTLTVSTGSPKSFKWKYIVGTGKLAGIQGGGTGSFVQMYPRNGSVSGGCWTAKGTYTLPK